MYKRVGDVSNETISYLKDVLKIAAWKDVIGPEDDFKTWFSEVEGFEYKQAFFIKIPPGGQVHKHTDTPREEKTYHIPIMTNDHCVSYIGDEAYHLEVGGKYEVNRDIEHESFNFGKTDRIHLLLECI